MGKLSTEQVENWLIEEISAITGTESKLIDPAHSLSQNGISSMGFLELLLGVSRQFKIESLPTMSLPSAHLRTRLPEQVTNKWDSQEKNIIATVLIGSPLRLTTSAALPRPVEIIS